MNLVRLPLLPPAAEEVVPGARRSKTLSVDALAREARRAQQGDLFAPCVPAPEAYDRPVTRADCLPGGMNEQRPCPFASCKWHLAVDVDPTDGSLRLNFPRHEIDEMPHTCALDIADRDGATLEEVGVAMQLGRERVRQIEEQALAQLEDDPESEGMFELLEREITRGIQPNDEDAALDVPHGVLPPSPLASVKRYPERVGEVAPPAAPPARGSWAPGQWSERWGRRGAVRR